SLGAGGGADPAGGGANVVPRQALNHAMMIGAANGIRRVDNDRTCFPSIAQPIKDRTALAHHEQVGEIAFELNVGCNEVHAEAARGHRCANTFHDGAVRIDASRRVRQLAVDAQTGPRRAHGFPTIARSRPISDASAAAMSRAVSMSNTKGRMMPRSGGC